MKTFQLTESERKLVLNQLYGRFVTLASNYNMATTRRDRKEVILERRRVMGVICKLEGRQFDLAEAEV